MSASENPTAVLTELRTLGQKLVAELTAGKPPPPNSVREQAAKMLGFFKALDKGQGSPKQWLENLADEQAVLKASAPVTDLLEKIRDIAKRLDVPPPPGSPPPPPLRVRINKWVALFQDLDQVLSEGGDAPNQWGEGGGE